MRGRGKIGREWEEKRERKRESEITMWYIQVLKTKTNVT